jgi:hypothetical protein
MSGKQKETTATSFLRIASGLKTRSRAFKRAIHGTPDDYAISESLKQVAEEILAEGKKLRAMR